MKKTIALLTGLMCIMSLTACGNNNPESSSESAKENSEQETTSENTESSASETSESDTSAESSDSLTAESKDGKTLVVYYSASGNTAKVAEYIADEAGGNLFEIQPVNVYSDADLDWTNENSRVCMEYENPDLRDIELVSTNVDDWDSYDTVFIGYPIWWGDAAWVVNNFVKENDFTGKNVIPFCTSATSDIGESGELLAEMAGSGNWQSGERFRSGASESDVKDWVKSLDLN